MIELNIIVTISDRRKSEWRWNYTLFDSSYHRSPRLHIKHMLKYPNIRENEGEWKIRTNINNWEITPTDGIWTLSPLSVTIIWLLVSFFNKNKGLSQFSYTIFHGKWKLFHRFNPWKLVIGIRTHSYKKLLPQINIKRHFLWVYL